MRIRSSQLDYYAEAFCERKQRSDSEQRDCTGSVESFDASRHGFGQLKCVSRCETAVQIQSAEGGELWTNRSVQAAERRPRAAFCAFCCDETTSPEGSIDWNLSETNMMVQSRSFCPESSRCWSNVGQLELNSTTAAPDDYDDDDNCRPRKVKLVETPRDKVTTAGKLVQRVCLISSEAHGPALLVLIGHMRCLGDRSGKPNQ